MALEQVIALARLNIGSVVAPDIAAVTPVFAKLDIIGVTPLAGLEDKPQLMLGAVERSHAGVALHPDRDVFQLGIDVATGREQFVGVAPIHAHIVDRSVFAEFCKQRAAARQKPSELFSAEFAGAVGEFAVTDLSFSRDVAIDRNIVRWIDEYNIRVLSIH